MPGINLLFSGRNLPQPAISYGPLSPELKVQLVFVFKDFINNLSDQWGHKEGIGRAIWEIIDNTLRREHGLHALYDDYHSLHQSLASWYMVCQYFENLSDVWKELDVIYAVCQEVEKCTDPKRLLFSDYSPSQAIADINKRLQQHGIGYRWQNGEMIKVPSEFTYEQSIAPSLVLLHQTEFKNAQQEFIGAFEHYKKGPAEYEAALTSCLKSIESAIKIIATMRSWEFEPNSTAQPLINLVLAKGLVPSYSESFLTGVKNTLLSGVPTIRNKMGGHGKGPTARIVDDATVHYCINLTASVILYLVQRHHELP